ncbi:MAG: hypothetical protein HYW26_02085 [Candidatus Aenigmarchaeota archaeon]|nr:hypothetical protein [Candidatus Aenigmarchaeota archaeon]
MSISVEEFRRLYFENQTVIDNARAEIIKFAIDLDVFLERIITIYFVENSTKQKQFSSYIGKKEFFSFHRKIEVFRKLGLDKKEKYEGKFNELVSKLYYIKSMRNIVAHNVPMIHTPEIWYTGDDDKEKLLSLPKELPQLRESHEFCMDALDTIFSDLLNEKK